MKPSTARAEFTAMADKLRLLKGHLEDVDDERIQSTLERLVEHMAEVREALAELERLLRELPEL